MRPSRPARAGAIDAGSTAAVGSLITAVNDFGVKTTTVLHQVGYGALASNSDVIVLSTLYIEGPQRPNVLTRLTGLTSGGTTNLLDRLASAGLVHRDASDVEDGRGVLVELTRRGRRSIEEVADVFASSLVAEPDAMLAMQERLAAIDLEVPSFPSSLTDVRAQLRDLMGMADFGRCISEILGEAFDDPTPAKSTLTLWYAAQPGGVRPGRLTELTGLSSAGVSELLERLESRQLIERTAGRPPDRRVVTVTITEVGQHQLDVALDLLAGRLGELCDRLAAR